MKDYFVFVMKNRRAFGLILLLFEDERKRERKRVEPSLYIFFFATQDHRWMTQSPLPMRTAGVTHKNDNIRLPRFVQHFCYSNDTR